MLSWSSGSSVILPQTAIPTASPSTAYSVGASIALPYKTTYAKTTMPAPIAAAPILRRTPRLLLTSKRWVVDEGYYLAPPDRTLDNGSHRICAPIVTRHLA